MVNNQLSISSQCVAVAKNTNALVACLDKRISNRDTEILLHTYFALVHALLEYYDKFWFSQFSKDVERESSEKRYKSD